MRLLKRRILVKPIVPNRETKSGIFIPETVKESFNRASVKLVAEDCQSVKPSHTILYREGAGIPIDSQGEHHLIMFEHDIVAIV